MYTGPPLFGFSLMHRIFVLFALMVSCPSWAKPPQKPAADKVSCPSGYQLVNGTYRITKGSGVPQKAYAQGNTLVVEHSANIKVQAIAVCARIPL